jgi:hypothetical protein
VGKGRSGAGQVWDAEREGFRKGRRRRRRRGRGRERSRGLIIPQETRAQRQKKKEKNLQMQEKAAKREVFEKRKKKGVR